MPALAENLHEAQPVKFRRLSLRFPVMKPGSVDYL
jgi:hypothetical protein